ncbi:hypothetical protein [Haloarcula sebkhae]|uniref:Uncharacterized protein n=2 Tax=Haloarcula sebkhae TaxID=932660 RepID=A0A830ENW7_9EURY|nr:hypothetical protein [Haloarcula sebkhae]GGK63461.1 hypothetical protein GCM10009067_14760 [Haloarcula sebkhae]
MSEQSDNQSKKNLGKEATQSSEQIDWRGFGSGAFFILSLIAGGAFINSVSGMSSSGIINSYSALLVSYFIGSTAGHYYGRAISDRGSSLHSAYLGASTILVGFWLFRVRVSPLSAALIFMTISLMLAHGTDIIKQSSEIRRAVDYFAKGVSPLGMLLFGVFEFIPSGIIEPGKIVSTIHNSLTQDVLVLGATLNIVVFAVGGFIIVCLGILLLAGILAEP